jgi:UrcA family protein
MTKKLYGLCGALVIFGTAAAWAAGTEEVTVNAPYIIRQQTLTRNLSGLPQDIRTTVESGVGYADLDFSKQADVDTMRDRLRKAARDSCRLVHRNPHLLGYIPTDEAACVRTATLQSLAQLDEIRATAGRSANRQSARN